jgi:hypothetical protein
MSDYASVETFRSRLERIVNRPREEKPKPVTRRFPNKHDDGKRSEIEALLKSEPRPSYVEIAAKVNCSRQRVSRIARADSTNGLDT